MGGGGGVQAPTLNASQISADQTKANVNAGVSTSELNNVNQVTPYGNLNYNQTGGQYDYNGNWIPQFTATSTLSPDQQNLQNLSNAQKAGLFSLGTNNTNIAQGYTPALQQGLSVNIPGLPTFGALPDATQYKNDAYNALMSRGNIQLGQQTDAQTAMNANQGVAAGSDAYNRSYQPINQQRVDLGNQAVIGAQGLANELQSNEIAGRNWTLQDAQANVQNAIQQQQAPLQNYASLVALANGQQPVTTSQPNFVQTTPSQIQATDTTSPQMAAFSAQNQQYLQSQQAQAAQSQAMMTGLFGLGGSALSGGAFML